MTNTRKEEERRGESKKKGKVRKEKREVETSKKKGKKIRRF